MTVGPRAAGLDPADLGRAMLRVAVGDYADEAAILLLLTFGHWLPQLHAADLIILDPGLDGGGPWARIRCPDLEPAVAAGLIVGSSGEMRVLRAATSITDSSPVDLGDLAAGLDRRVLTLLLAALAHAAGNDHRDVSFGAEVVPRPGDPATPAESRGPVWAPSESGDGARRSHLPYRTGEPFASAHNVQAASALGMALSRPTGVIAPCLSRRMVPVTVDLAETKGSTGSIDVGQLSRGVVFSMHRVITVR